MLYYRPEKKMYRTRSELREKIGTATYNKELKADKIIFINDDDVEFITKTKD